jgi:hypothetical protein
MHLSPELQQHRVERDSAYSDRVLARVELGWRVK